jgi:hypothetical protein
MADIPYSTDDPRYHTHKMRRRFESLIDDLRTEIDHVDDPHAKSMLETAAEVIGGVQEAFEDYEEADEKAWEETDHA